MPSSIAPQPIAMAEMPGYTSIIMHDANTPPKKAGSMVSSDITKGRRKARSARMAMAPANRLCKNENVPHVPAEDPPVIHFNFSSHGLEVIQLLQKYSIQCERVVIERFSKKRRRGFSKESFPAPESLPERFSPEPLLP